MRKTITVGLALFVVCLVSGCDEQSQELIVGTWNVKQQVGPMEISGKTEFRKNGGMTTTAMGKRIDSTYRFIDSNNIEVEMSVGGRKLIERNRIDSISKDKMVLIDPQGGKAIFTRSN